MKRFPSSIWVKTIYDRSIHIAHSASTKRTRVAQAKTKWKWQSSSPTKWKKTETADEKIKRKIQAKKVKTSAGPWRGSSSDDQTNIITILGPAWSAQERTPPTSLTDLFRYNTMLIMAFSSNRQTNSNNPRKILTNPTLPHPILFLNTLPHASFPFLPEIPHPPSTPGSFGNPPKDPKERYYWAWLNNPCRNNSHGSLINN